MTRKTSGPAASPRIVLIGASAGGVTAVQKILSQLKLEMQLPIVVVQHLARSPRANLSQVYMCGDRRQVLEPEDKQLIENGLVYFATPDYHLLIERDFTFAHSQDEPVHFSRPSIDVMFQSAHRAYGSDVLAILLTGANRDGAEGLCEIFRQGGEAVAQDPAEAEVDVMPKAAIHLCGIKKVLKLSEISALINSFGDSSQQVNV